MAGTERQVVSQFVDGTPVEVYQAFLNVVWRGGGGLGPIPPSIVQEGNKKTGHDCIRQVPGGIQEHIIEANGKNKIVYRVKSGPFPVSFHLGTVEFLQTCSGTQVVWQCDYSPYFGFSTILYYVISMSFGMMLGTLAKSQEKKKRSGSWFFWAVVVALLGIFLYPKIIVLSGDLTPLPGGPVYLNRLEQLRLETPEVNAAIEKSSFLVIGGNGFTGSALVADLLARDAKQVKILSRSLPSAEKRVLGVDYVQGDVSKDDERLQSALAGVDIIMHTAAHYGDPSFTKMGDGKRTDGINYGGMVNLMKRGREAGVKQLIYTSSVDTAFCGGYSTENASEDGFMEKYVDVRCPDYGPPDHYAATKLRAEREMLKSDGEAGMRTIAIRPNGIYGPSENSYLPKAVLPGYLMNYIFFYFDKEQKSDMSCLYNLVYAHMLAVKCLDENPDNCGGKPYFITDGVVTNNAAWTFFQPIMEATGAFVQLWLYIPPPLLVSVSHYLEVLGIPGMTEKEAHKATTTHTHSIANAQKDLGYKVLMPMYECLCHTGEEFSRRFEVANTDEEASAVLNTCFANYNVQL